MPAKPISEPKAVSAKISQTGCSLTLSPTSFGVSRLPSTAWPTRKTAATATIIPQLPQNCTSPTPIETMPPVTEPTKGMNEMMPANSPISTPNFKPRTVSAMA